MSNTPAWTGAQQNTWMLLVVGKCVIFSQNYLIYQISVTVITKINSTAPWKATHCRPNLTETGRHFWNTTGLRSPICGYHGPGAMVPTAIMRSRPAPLPQKSPRTVHAFLYNWSDSPVTTWRWPTYRAETCRYNPPVILDANIVVFNCKY